jgi:hypothetical protein
VAKPPIRQVPSDDCLVEVDGTEYKVHEGEWVKVISSFAVGSLHVMRRVTELQSQMDSLEDDEEIRKALLVDDVVIELVDVLKGRIVEWTWTNDLGEPLPQPLNNPDAFQALRIEELMYLALVVRGESPAEQGNGSAPSRTTPSATPQRRSQTPSSGGRSRSRA